MCIRELLLQKNEDKRKCCRMSTEVEKQFRKMLPQNLERVKEAKKNAKGLLMKFKKKRFWKGVEKAKQEASKQNEQRTCVVQRLRHLSKTRETQVQLYSYP